MDTETTTTGVLPNDSCGILEENSITTRRQTEERLQVVQSTIIRLTQDNYGSQHWSPADKTQKVDLWWKNSKSASSTVQEAQAKIVANAIDFRVHRKQASLALKKAFTGRRKQKPLVTKIPNSQGPRLVSRKFQTFAVHESERNHSAASMDNSRSRTESTLQKNDFVTDLNTFIKETARDEVLTAMHLGTETRKTELMPNDYFLFHSQKFGQ